LPQTPWPGPRHVKPLHRKIRCMPMIDNHILRKYEECLHISVSQLKSSQY